MTKQTINNIICITMYSYVLSLFNITPSGASRYLGQSSPVRFSPTISSVDPYCLLKNTVPVSFHGILLMDIKWIWDIISNIIQYIWDMNILLDIKWDINGISGILNGILMDIIL